MKKAVVDDNAVLALHSEGYSTTKISALLKTSVGRIRTVLEEIGVEENKYTRPLKEYPEDLLNIVKTFYGEGDSIKKIVLKTNIHFEAIKRVVTDNNLQRNVIVPEDHKLCSKCKKIQPFSNFGNSSASKDGLKSYCKSCRKLEPSRKEYLKLWASNNKELKAKSGKEYRFKNKAKIRLQKRSERGRAVKALSDKKYAEKIKACPGRRMAARIRSMISGVVKNKNFKTFELLGYTSKELTAHLESLFVVGMSWENYGRGRWHIDHIKPLVLFDLTKEEEIKKAFALENLQPLFEGPNCSKGSFYEGKRHYKTT